MTSVDAFGVRVDLDVEDRIAEKTVPTVFNLNGHIKEVEKRIAVYVYIS
ncbi:hypothetical protein [Geomicrobium sp. JCM 19039]|nr:hypothetical protein [Geomicrobium sp. JCM 19039]